MTFNSKLLIDLRAACDMTQGELSEHLGVTDRSISHYECGRRTPTIPVAKRVVALAGAKGFTIGRVKRPIVIDDLFPD